MLTSLGQAALAAVEGLMRDATAAVRARVTDQGRLSNAALEREQHAAHGLAWLATYVEAIREMLAYAVRLDAEGRFGETENLLTRIGLGEYLAQIFGGIPMSQGEFVRPADFGLGLGEVAARSERRRRRLDRDRQYGRPSRPPRRADRSCGGRGDDRRSRPRRDARSDPRGNPQIRRSRSHAARP